MESKKKGYQWTYLQNRSRVTDGENKLNGHQEISGWLGPNWEIGIDINTLPYTQQAMNKNLLYSIENCIQYSVMTCMGKESKIEKKRVNIHICITYSLCHTPETNTHCKSTINSVQSLSCLTLCDPMDCSTPGFPVHHQLLELAQTQVHWVGDAIQPSQPSKQLYSNRKFLKITKGNKYSYSGQYKLLDIYT